MRKQISISTINRVALNTLLPLGAHKQIQSRLDKKDIKVTVRTIGRAFKEDYPITPKISAIIKEAVSYRDEILNRQKIEVSDQLAQELTATGSWWWVQKKMRLPLRYYMQWRGRLMPTNLHNRIVMAKSVGMGNALIAKRLECSERTVRRALEIEPVGYTENPFMGTDMEWTAWRFHQVSLDWSLRKIAFYFCLSHEYIRKILNEKSNKEAV